MCLSVSYCRKVCLVSRIVLYLCVCVCLCVRVFVCVCVRAGGCLGGRHCDVPSYCLTGVCSSPSYVSLLPCAPGACILPPEEAHTLTQAHTHTSTQARQTNTQTLAHTLAGPHAHTHIHTYTATHACRHTGQHTHTHTHHSYLILLPYVSGVRSP